TDTSNDNDSETSDTDDTDSKNTVTILVGDVNKDEKITARDSLLAQRYVIKLTSLDELAALAADVNNDGKVDNRDCLDILRYSIGVAVKSDVGEYREVTITEDTDTSDTETDVETSGNDAVFNIKYDKGIGGALFFIYYNDDLFEFDSITFKTDNNDSDMFVITANDDKLGTVKVNAINQTDYPAKWVSFVLHFKPIDPNNKESASFTATFEELVSYDAKVVENPDNYGGLNFRIS
ncbi:MAG: dockerin type I repeat-containing protein, partial [Clostridia bacterium]|nr:dockerin type I repeat-containing protein [Clostridia bacterium]